PELRGWNHSSRSRSPHPRCYGEQAAADTPKHNRYRSGPESSGLRREGAVREGFLDVATRPARRFPIASALSVYALRPVTARLHTVHRHDESFLRKQPPLPLLAYPPALPAKPTRG